MISLLFKTQVIEEICTHKKNERVYDYKLLDE